MTKSPQNIIPPTLARKILLRFLRNDLAEEVLGDLEEKFYSQVNKRSVFRAKLNYWFQVMNYLRPFAVRKSRPSYSNHYDMFQNYFKIGWRNLLRNQGYSAINIGGLAIGMAVAMLNGFWIWDELSFNKHHRNYERIGQVVKSQINEGESGVGYTMNYPLGTELRTHYSDHFKHIVRVSWVADYILSTEEKKISATGQYVDLEIAEMLTLEMMYGNWSALKDTHSILLSESTATLLFGNDDPLNKTVRLNNKTDLRVTGVYKDLPLNTKFHNIGFFTPWQLFLLNNPWIEERALTDWRNHFIQIYVEILPGGNFVSVSEQIKDAELRNLSAFKEEAARKPQIFLHPMSKWHLFPYGDRGQPSKEPLQMVWLVGLIGMFVLTLACINFMNLSTARSEKRAKEVGIRKTIGSVRNQLISQFFSESYLIVLVAFALAFLIVGISLPSFNDLTAKQITILWTNKWFWVMSLVFIFITGLLAGSYPAFYLSSFNPIKVLKGTFRAGTYAAIPRKILVVMQFTISIVLIICTVIVYQQIQWGKDRPVGYDRSRLVMMQMKSSDFYGKYDVLRNELKSTGAVDDMSQSMGPVTNIYSGNDGFEWNGKPLHDDSFGTLAVTHEHGKTVGWQLIAGRDFSREYASDSAAMVINESAAKFFGGENPVGELVTWKWWMDDRPPLHYKIIGVVKDMVMESPYEPAEPTVFYIRGHNGTVNFINIKISPESNIRDALTKIESVFKKIVPSAPFEYKFVDEEYASKFAVEERIGKLASVFGTLAILISLLGLLGLAAFVAEQRTKEIGIRKVLGATVANVWQMLSKDFILLVIIACFIAVPISRYYMGAWLEKYEYRVDISWWVFVLTGLGALFITLMTISYQAIRAALMNPANSLRSE